MKTCQHANPDNANERDIREDDEVSIELIAVRENDPGLCEVLYGNATLDLDATVSNELRTAFIKPCRSPFRALSDRFSAYHSRDALTESCTPDATSVDQISRNEGKRDDIPPPFS